jgi:predicted nucleic acid-binding protein
VIIADTGFWLALANARDANHARARAALTRHRGPFINHLASHDRDVPPLGQSAQRKSALAFIRSGALGAFEIFALESSHPSRIEALMTKYRDLPMDLADASLVILAEELGTGRILSTDKRDFGAYRWKNRKPFRNLLAES